MNTIGSPAYEAARAALLLYDLATAQWPERVGLARELYTLWMRCEHLHRAAGGSPEALARHAGRGYGELPGYWLTPAGFRFHLSRLPPASDQLAALLAQLPPDAAGEPPPDWDRGILRGRGPIEKPIAYPIATEQAP
jgi:hypothetical protein